MAQRTGTVVHSPDRSDAIIRVIIRWLVHNYIVMVLGLSSFLFISFLLFCLVYVSETMHKCLNVAVSVYNTSVPIPIFTYSVDHSLMPSPEIIRLLVL